MQQRILTRILSDTKIVKTILVSDISLAGTSINQPVYEQHY